MKVIGRTGSRGQVQQHLLADGPELSAPAGSLLQGSTGLLVLVNWHCNLQLASSGHTSACEVFG